MTAFFTSPSFHVFKIDSIVLGMLGNTAFDFLFKPGMGQVNRPLFDS